MICAHPFEIGRWLLSIRVFSLSRLSLTVRLLRFKNMKICPQCAGSFDDKLTICPNDNAELIQSTAGPPDPMIGRVLAGRYRLTQKIGEGGMGVIYKAIHVMMGRTCAIKLLTNISADHQTAVVRFNREAKMASSIDNPHAVTIFDFGENEEGVLYLVMEFIDGKPLSQLMIKEKQVDPKRAVNITSQIAEALEAAHRLGIVHRDLKPDNIMLCQKPGEPDYVKVLDFGIAKSVSDDGSDNVTKTGYVLGTPVYMSPEQLAGEKVDGRSDIYSLAIIVYEMICGGLPFEGENSQAIMIKRIMTDPVPLRDRLPSVNDALEREVMAALSRDPETRTQTVQAFASQLQTALQLNTQIMGSRNTSEISDGQTREWSSAKPDGDKATEQATVAGSATSFDTPSFNESARRPTQEDREVSGRTQNFTSQKGPEQTGPAPVVIPTLLEDSPAPPPPGLPRAGAPLLSPDPERRGLAGGQAA